MVMPWRWVTTTGEKAQLVPSESNPGSYARTLCETMALVNLAADATPRCPRCLVLLRMKREP